MERTKVEPYRLTKQQKMVGKRMQMFNKAETFLKNRGMRHIGAMQSISEMFQELQAGKKELMLKAPDQATLELDQEL